MWNFTFVWTIPSNYSVSFYLSTFKIKKGWSNTIWNKNSEYDLYSYWKWLTSMFFDPLPLWLWSGHIWWTKSTLEVQRNHHYVWQVVSHQELRCKLPFLNSDNIHHWRCSKSSYFPDKRKQTLFLVFVTVKIIKKHLPNYTSSLLFHFILSFALHSFYSHSLFCCFAQHTCCVVFAKQNWFPLLTVISVLCTHLKFVFHAANEDKGETSPRSQQHSHHIEENRSFIHRIIPWMTFRNTNSHSSWRLSQRLISNFVPVSSWQIVSNRLSSVITMQKLFSLSPLNFINTATLQMRI